MILNYSCVECLDGNSSLTIDTFAYVSCDDVHSVSEFEDENVIAIKAPRHTRLEVADPQEVSRTEAHLLCSSSLLLTCFLDSTNQIQQMLNHRLLYLK